jgi:membrane-bound lytic murein transglycosylase F
LITGAVLIALGSWLGPELPVDDPKWHRDHDVQLRKHAKHYFSVATDWRWFRAQGIVESGLRRHATSNRGAVGVMQIIPSTFQEIWQEHWLLPGITEPRWNVAAGIAYDHYLFQRWRHRVPAAQRFEFTLASYNAGFNGVNRARESARAAGGDANDWSDVAHHVPQESRNYVTKIKTLMGDAE